MERGGEIVVVCGLSFLEGGGVGYGFLEDVDVCVCVCMVVLLGVVSIRPVWRGRRGLWVGEGGRGGLYIYFLLSLISFLG